MNLLDITHHKIILLTDIQFLCGEQKFDPGGSTRYDYTIIFVNRGESWGEWKVPKRRAVDLGERGE